MSGNHTFQWDIGVGAEAEAGIVVAKAKTRIDTKISNSWTWSSTQTVKDHNGGKTIVVIVPRKGDMSIGRQKK